MRARTEPQLGMSSAREYPTRSKGGGRGAARLRRRLVEKCAVWRVSVEAAIASWQSGDMLLPTRRQTEVEHSRLILDMP